MVMEKPMTDLAYVERELASLTNQLKQSFEVLDDLAQVQTQFNDLARTHQKFKDVIDSQGSALDTMAQLQKIIDQRFGDLETQLDSYKKELRGQLLDVQAEIGVGDRTLKTELMQQINGLKRDLDERMMDAAQEWERQRDAVKAPLEEFENRLRSEIKAAVNWVNQSGVNVGQVEMLDTQIRANRNTIQTLEKQMRQLQNWLVFSIVLIVILALGLPITLLISKAHTNRVNNSLQNNPDLPSPAENQTP